MKGIILAGGSGSRLYPLTKSVSKQLLPVYDKPMIYYPLSVLMLAGIREILIISTPEDLPRFENLFGDGSDIGMKFDYKVQPSPDGIAQAFIIGKDFIGSDSVALILGDNIFYGQGITDLLEEGMSDVSNNSATVFSYHVKDPSRYGVIAFDDLGQAISIKEKPNKPRSSFAITGLYFYPNDVVKKALQLTPSKRGELEITDINQRYLKENRLKVQLLGRGYAWLDTGQHDELLGASTFIETIERRQGLKVACIEEIAFDKGYISREKLISIAKNMNNNEYAQYLMDLVR
ncbi:glucose-1-phosphate thymidylyltransferase RfbA [Candidatus Pseudothioglobus singularis]|nr:glucose-1-phosphate thymidylyltransferase RfbA [Candidatus Pseudothioglobus singularis]